MSNLFLIAHKVSGKPAFDIATKMTCPECGDRGPDEEQGCLECDHLGYWWIIPTSGHRAYPYNWAYYDFEHILPHCTDGPESVPDHYLHRASPQEVRTRIEDLISTLLPSPPTKPFVKRKW